MKNVRTDFWRGFTWKRMLRGFLMIFLLTLLFDILLDRHNAGQFFQPIALLKRFIMATVLSFLFSLWHEPVDKHTTTSGQRGDA